MVDPVIPLKKSSGRVHTPLISKAAYTAPLVSARSCSLVKASIATQFIGKL